jgi:hypothetical protein
MGVKEGPDREPRDIVEHEDECRVLQCRVMARGKEVSIELAGAVPALRSFGCFFGAQALRFWPVNKLEHAFDFRWARPIA